MIRGALTAALGLVTGGSAVRLVSTLIVGVALGGWAGWNVQGWRQGHLQVKAIERQARDTLRQVENRDRASKTYQTGEAHADKTHAEIRDRVRTINARPDAAGQCLDDDGLLQLGAAIDNGAPAAAGSVSAVPAAGTAD